jgi:glutathione S-transferase
MDRLYWSPDNANLVVRMVLHELALPYETVAVDRARQAQRAPAFLALNPQGLLPVLVAADQDAPLFETAAILLYLADREGRLGAPAPAARGRLLKWLFYLADTLHADLRIRFHAERYVAAAAAAPALRSGVQARVAGHLALLDAAIAEGGGPWLLGGDLSVLDPYLACCVRWAQLYPPGEGLVVAAVRRLPALVGLLEALARRPAVREACAREGITGALFLAPSLPGSG